jgi:DNA-binding NarL/FixJ family response regulator
MKEQLKILIVDDQDYFRSWLKQLLTANFPNIISIAEAENAEESVGIAAKLNPDVIFMDIEFRNQPMHGIAAAERIWKNQPQVAIIICSAHKEEVFIKKLVKIVPTDGTYGYVLKDQSVQRFVDAGKAVFSSESWIDPEIYKIVRRPTDKNVDLTDSEYETIVLIALGLGDRACAELLYVGEKAVQARLSQVYSKLGLPAKGTPEAGTLNNRCRAVWMARQKGLIHDADLRQHEDEVSKLAKSRGMNLSL